MSYTVNNNTSDVQKKVVKYCIDGRRSSGGRPKGAKDKKRRRVKDKNGLYPEERKPPGRPRTKIQGLKPVSRISDAELHREVQEIERQLLAQYEIKEKYTREHLWEFYEPLLWQERLFEAVRTNLITVAPAPNKIGKTTSICPLVCSWLKGYEAWNVVDIGYPGAVKVNDLYYKPSSLGIKPPVKIRLTGEDWNHHLGQVVVRELKKWLPLQDFVIKKNSAGVEWLWEDMKSGSTLELMTHGMDYALFESWRGHGWIADEPPPFGLFKAMGRGLFGNKGKMVFPTTPLSQAWILDELVLKNRTDTAVLQDLCILDNEIFYAEDDCVLTEMGLGGISTKYWRDATLDKKEFFRLLLYVDDQGSDAEKFLLDKTKSSKHHLINDLKFLRFAKDTAIDEKPSRFFGTFKKLVGLVIKNFNPSLHIIRNSEDFKVPTNWPVTVMIDFHLSKPHAISFYACDEHNRHYAIDEHWINCSAEEIADLIIRRKTGDTLWNITDVYIDPLSAGDNKYMKNRFEDTESAFAVIEERLDAKGIELHVAKKDKTSGFMNIRKWLAGPNKIPILFFLDKLQSFGSSTHNGVLYEIQRLAIDQDTGQIEKVNDDFMENLYRYTLTGVEYREYTRERIVSVGMGVENSLSW